MSEYRPIRLLIADDHSIIREGLKAVLNHQADMCVVAEAATGTETVNAFMQHKPDLTLVDLSMPDGDGISAIQKIRQESVNARLIVLTQYSGDEYIYRAIQAGAKGYLLKTSPIEQLIEAIRVVHQGGTLFPPEITARLASRMSHEHLTRREQEVLDRLALGQSNQEIGRALSISEGTVKAHISSILAKLGAGDRTQALLIAMRRGLVPTL